MGTPSFESRPLFRPALLGLTLIIIGTQTIFSAFFLSLLTIRLEHTDKQ